MRCPLAAPAARRALPNAQPLRPRDRPAAADVPRACRGSLAGPSLRVATATAAPPWRDASPPRRRSRTAEPLRLDSGFVAPLAVVPVPAGVAAGGSVAAPPPPGAHAAAASSLVGVAAHAPPQRLAHAAPLDAAPPDEETQQRAINKELVALGRGPRWRDALARFDALCAQRNPAPNVHVATTAIAVAARNGAPAAAQRAFAYLRAEGLAPTAHTYTALARARGGEGDWRGALALLDEMDAACVAPTAHTAAALLSACARGGAEGAAAAAPLFARLSSSLPAAQLDAHLVTCFLTLFGRLADADGAQRVWAWAAAAGVAPDAHSHCALLTALLRARQPRAAALHFRTLRPAPPSAHVVAAGMRALTAAGAPAAESRAAFDALRAAGVPPNAHCYAALLAAHARAGDAPAALRVLASMRAAAAADAAAPAPTVVCLHLAMSACAKGARWREADALLQQLRADDVAGAAPRADVVSFATAMLAAAAAGRADVAERQWAEMVADGVAPNDYVATALIGAHGAAARAAAARAGGAAAAAASLRAALACRARCAAAGVRPSVHSFNALIDAADGARDWGRALALHTEMCALGIAPNAATRALMASVGQRGADDVAVAQTRLAAVSAAAATLAAALIQKGWL